jgi:hypothetical protein
MAAEDQCHEAYMQTGAGDLVDQDKNLHGDEVHGDNVLSDKTNAGNIDYDPIRLTRLFAPLIEGHIKLFAGRNAVLAAIDQFIRKPAGSYLVVTAPAGFGKTALMARLVSGASNAFAYHFFTAHYVETSLDESFFLRNVVGQMAQWHGLTGQIPGRLNDLRALYYQFRDEPLERTQVLVLDGLDEVTHWKLAPYLSRRLHEKLRVIVTVRDMSQDWRDAYQFPADQVTHLSLDGLTRDDVAQVLHAVGVARPNDSSLLDKVMRVSAYQANEALGAD